MYESEEKTYEQFIAENHLEMRVIKLGRTKDGEWDRDSWSVTIISNPGSVHKYGEDNPSPSFDRSLTTEFHMGIGHKGKKPDLPTVLDCLRSDAEVGSYDPFEFMLELGYDNAREARKAYRACTKIREDLIALLGESSFQDLINNVERL
jgi:hypothetical protein